MRSEDGRRKTCWSKTRRTTLSRRTATKTGGTEANASMIDEMDEGVGPDGARVGAAGAGADRRAKIDAATTAAPQLGRNGRADEATARKDAANRPWTRRKGRLEGNEWGRSRRETMGEEKEEERKRRCGLVQKPRQLPATRREEEEGGKRGRRKEGGFQ